MATGFQNPVGFGYGQKFGEKLGQEFFSDDPLVLPVSIYLESSETAEEIVAATIELARAYGFTDISTVESAPGSFFGSFTAKFHNKDHDAAKRSKKELKADLLKEKAPKDPKKARAVKQVHSLLSKNAKKKIRVWILIAASALGHFAGDVAYDIAKDKGKEVTVAAASKAAQGADQLASSELTPAEAAKIHGTIKFFITQSPEKSEHAPPPPAPGEK